MFGCTGLVLCTLFILITTTLSILKGASLVVWFVSPFLYCIDSVVHVSFGVWLLFQQFHTDHCLFLPEASSVASPWHLMSSSVFWWFSRWAVIPKTALYGVVFIALWRVMFILYESCIVHGKFRKSIKSISRIEKWMTVLVMVWLPLWLYWELVCVLHAVDLSSQRD